MILILSNMLLYNHVIKAKCMLVAKAETQNGLKPEIIYNFYPRAEARGN